MSVDNRQQAAALLCQHGATLTYHEATPEVPKHRWSLEAPDKTPLEVSRQVAGRMRFNGDLVELRRTWRDVGHLETIVYRLSDRLRKNLEQRP